MKMSSQNRSKVVREAESALAETLRKARAEVAKHVQVGEGAGPIPREVYYVAQYVLEVLDDALEAATIKDLDDDIDDAIEDIDR
jgi:hypothetical protein